MFSVGKRVTGVRTYLLTFKAWNNARSWRSHSLQGENVMALRLVRRGQCLFVFVALFTFGAILPCIFFFFAFPAETAKTNICRERKKTPKTPALTFFDASRFSFDTLYDTIKYLSTCVGGVGGGTRVRARRWSRIAARGATNKTARLDRVEEEAKRLLTTRVCEHGAPLGALDYIDIYSNKDTTTTSNASCIQSRSRDHPGG